MLSIDPNIIFIDDKEEEVKGIIQLYQNEGHGVKFFNADFIIGDNHPTSTYSDVNLIFLDLFYQDTFDVELCTGWISSIIPENSFYVLVLWSKDTQHEEAILDDLKKLNRSPYSLIIAQKGLFMGEENQWNFESLYSTVSEKLKENPELEELTIWKKSIRQSSNQIIGHLAQNEENDIFKNRLKKIIVGHGGKSFISNDNFEQKREILFEALDQVLVSNAKEERPEVEISPSNKEHLYSIEPNIQVNIDSKLNSWFHFKLHKKPINQDDLKHGLISKFRFPPLEKIYKIVDDENVAEYLKHQITKSKESESNTILSNICIVLVRPCDLAQNKYGKNIKLLSGVLVENPVRKTNPRKEFKTGNKYDSIKLFDHLYFSGKRNDLAMLFDFRYVFSVSETTFKTRFENIKIFNKELLSELQVEYSSYSSRLGITQII